MGTAPGSSPTVDFEALFHQSPAGYLVTETDGTILAANDTFLDRLGLSRDTVQGMNLLQLFAVGDRVVYATHALPQLALTGAVAELALDLVATDGTHHPAMLSATRTSPGPEGPAVDRIVVFGAARRRGYEAELETALRKVQDAENARARAEADTAAHREALVDTQKDLHASVRHSRINESLLNTILDTVDVGLAVVDADGNTLMKNNRYQQDLDHATPTDGDGDGDGDGSSITGLLVYGPDRTTPVPTSDTPTLRATLGASFTDELFWIGPPGNQRALNVSAHPVKGAEGFTGSVIASADVTSFIEALTVKDDFVANVSHELRTPLTAIIGYLELALDEPNLPGHLRTYLGVAMRNSDRLLQLVNDLLSTAASAGTVSPQPVDLAELLEASVESATLRAKTNNVHIIMNVPPALPAILDPLRITQVLDNLLSNAIKYSPDGGTVTLGARRTTEHIVLEVTDTGIGMTPEELEAAFTKFFRSRSVLKSAIPGAGLGLAITKNIIEAHRGTITLNSEPGHGTTATILLPTPVAPAQHAYTSPPAK